MSLKKNFIYSSILTVSTYLFPLIVYPYVSRTLGLSNIGIVNFVDNLVAYFVCFSMMGISTIGVREIAGTKGNQVQLSKTFISLLVLSGITTLIAIIALWIAMYTIPTLTPYRDLLYVGLTKLVFNFFLIEWFYTGMENFKYITNRALLVKCLYVASVFLFVKEASDYRLYFILTTLVVVVNALINIVYSRRFVNYSTYGINIRPLCKPFIIMGVYILLTTVYTRLNTVWLGFVTDTDQVGFFTTATKLYTIIMAVLLSFTNILFPRVSNLLAEGKHEEFWQKINIAFDAVFLFSFPTIIYMIVTGPTLLHFIVGDGFEGAYLPFRIITPLILIVGVEQILVIQILMAMHQDNIVLRNSFIGAIVVFFLNIIITPKLGAIGSSIVWVAAESTILILSAVSVWRKNRFRLPWHRFAFYVGTYAPLLAIALLIHHFMDNSIAMLTTLAATVIVYAILAECFFTKNKIVFNRLKR